MGPQPEFSIGEIITFEYPAYNSVDSRKNIWRTRTLLVSGIRDLARKSLHPVTIQKRPLTNRGRWLVTGTCLDCFEQRSFYWEAMKGNGAATWLTFGLYNPESEDDVPVHQFGVFAPNKRDRLFMRDVLKFYYDETEDRIDIDFTLGVFPILDVSSVSSLVSNCVLECSEGSKETAENT